MDMKEELERLCKTTILEEYQDLNQARRYYNQWANRLEFLRELTYVGVTILSVYINFDVGWTKNAVTTLGTSGLAIAIIMNVCRREAKERFNQINGILVAAGNASLPTAILDISPVDRTVRATKQLREREQQQQEERQEEKEKRYETIVGREMETTKEKVEDYKVEREVICVVNENK